jgi:hypothetical protein
MLRHTARAALTAQQQLVEADTRIRTRIKSEVLSFNSAADESLGAIEHSWSLDYEGDDTKRQRNHELLDELAMLDNTSPNARRGQACTKHTGQSRRAAPKELGGCP